MRWIGVGVMVGIGLMLAPFILIVLYWFLPLAMVLISAWLANTTDNSAWLLLMPVAFFWLWLNEKIADKAHQSALHRLR